MLSEAIRETFLSRGADELTSTLAAQMAVTAFIAAVNRWLDLDSDQPLPNIVHDTLAALRAVTADPPRRRTTRQSASRPSTRTCP